jgi:hypothetical protein
MAEFALVAPLLLVIIFGIIDFGRAIFYYSQIQNAVNEGARVAAQGYPIAASDTANTCPASGTISPYVPPCSLDVVAAMQSRAANTKLTTQTVSGSGGGGFSDSCVHGPLPYLPSGGQNGSNAATPPFDSGWIYITEAPAPTGAQEASPPDNAPEGDASAAVSSGDTTCNPTVPAFGVQPLQVTIIYNFRPLVIGPLLGVLTRTGNNFPTGIILQAHAVYDTEY